MVSVFSLEGFAMGSGLASAASITTSLKGIRLPATAEQIHQYAESTGAEKAVLLVLSRLPEGNYESASDIAQGISAASQELKDLVPNLSASEIVQYLAGISFPATRQQLVAVAKENEATEDVLSILQALPNDKFKNVIDIGRGLKGAKARLREEVLRKAK